MRELILGGQRSGKSARAEVLAAQWLGASSTHRALFIATATAWDEEMRERIARHQRDRAQRVPGMVTVEEPLDLAGVLAKNNAANTLVVVDCLTLWLTNLLMPAGGMLAKVKAVQTLWPLPSPPTPAPSSSSATKSAWA